VDAPDGAACVLIRIYRLSAVGQVDASGRPGIEACKPNEVKTNTSAKSWTQRLQLDPNFCFGSVLYENSEIV
jgi:hypothetical protein